MNNTLGDLNNALFEQIERLQDDGLSDEALKKEIRRTEAVTKVAKNIIDNGTLSLSVKKYLDEYGTGDKYEIPLLGASKNLR